MASMMDSMNTMISMIQLALSVIAGISLVVGGIGVMNIMLVSITERTKEIGTRKALGATNGSIRLQFITESVVICVIGGIIGIILGIALGTVAVKLMGYEAAVSIQSIVIAVGFSMAIGIFFGYYPANKAAKLNPIDALRYE
jgi:putative ABC transport system permease protein